MALLPLLPLLGLALLPVPRPGRSPAPAPGQVAVEGIVLGRRKLGRSMVFVDLATDGGEQQTLLKQQSSQGAQGSSQGDEAFLCHPLERMLYDPGARISIAGCFRAQEQGRALLVGQQVALLTAAPSAHGVRHLVEAVEAGAVRAEDAAVALLLEAPLPPLDEPGAVEAAPVEQRQDRRRPGPGQVLGQHKLVPVMMGDRGRRQHGVAGRVQNLSRLSEGAGAGGGDVVVEQLIHPA